SAGDEIDSWCTRCRIDLGHRIVAMVGTSPKRVMCMTCNSEHNYRPPKSSAVIAAPKEKKAKKATRTSRSQASLRDEWRSQVDSGSPFVSYSISQIFKPGQLVRHKKFGDGYVTTIGENKVSVAFIDGEKTLAMGVSS